MRQRTPLITRMITRMTTRITTLTRMRGITRVRSALRMALQLGALCCAAAGFGASPDFLTGNTRTSSPLSGGIFGQVRNANGIAQMGAGVQLYNRFDELVGRGLTNAQGVFVFSGLVPDIYTVRVFLASFVPAERRHIKVLPSVQNRLDINLTGVLSGVQLGASPLSGGSVITDDWKWVLRSSQATRPVLRLLPASHSDALSKQQPADSVSTSAHTSPFSNTTALLKFSGGDPGSVAQGAEQDLGTAFALATVLAGSGQVLFSGNVGYSANSSLPAAGIRTSYSRPMPDGSVPMLVFAARQIYLAPQAPTGESTPALRTLSAAFLDNWNVSPVLSFDYGVGFQGVSYIQHTSHVSPFLRVTYDAGNWGKVRAAASSGARPTELMVRDAESGSLNHGLDQGVAALGMMQTVSHANHQLTMERTRNVELGWDRVAGGRTYSAGAYDELVSNAAFMLSGVGSSIPPGDLLPDLSSHSEIFNVGSFERKGFVAAIKQTLGSWAEVSLAAGRTGALLMQPAPTPSSSFQAASYQGASFQGTSQAANEGQALRAGIHQAQRNWATLRVSGIVPGSHTRLSADYGWTDFQVLMPAHLFVTQSATQDIGVNFYVRQPLPIAGYSWRLEATAELRNMLAQGYLPLLGTTGILTNSPRAMRGGLNLVF